MKQKDLMSTYVQAITESYEYEPTLFVKPLTLDAKAKIEMWLEFQGDNFDAKWIEDKQAFEFLEEYISTLENQLRDEFDYDESMNLKEFKDYEFIADYGDLEEIEDEDLLIGIV